MTELAQMVAEIHEAPSAAELGDRLRAGVLLLSEDRLSLADFFRLLHELALASGEETFTLSARPMVAGTAEFVFSSAAHCATIGEAMHAIARAYNILHGDEYNLVETTSRGITYAVDDERFPYTVARDELLCMSLECALIVLHGALCHLAGRDLTPQLRWVATGRARSQIWATQALGFWDAPIRYQSRRYALTYDASVADAPLARHRGPVRPQLAIHSRIISLIEAHRPYTESPRGVVGQVVHALREGLQFQTEVAARLRVSVATLRRRLQEQDTSFRELRCQVLNERARGMLVDGGETGAIAEVLGFSDSRSFARAFHAWNGVSPATWARAARAE
ncbi:MAG TPA: AraC family transcriptional regulator ligand-binding domain-containing protein [Phenylobacterium sp.]|jgi:AraC-like DNA-binding protein|nr:AraC family transcriptional regulator ligand-binding domain-containing protein [Phenylobacterium sp.]